MSSSSLELYSNSCASLARTTKIHSKAMAVEVERRVGMLAGNREWYKLDKRKWRYYLNLSGQYHHIDERMFIISLDTLESIEFNKENLSESLNTKDAYQYGSSYYNALVKRYPEQEHLILSILHPVDIEKAVIANDFEILAWIPSLIEPQETSLLRQMQQWIYRWVDRFDNRTYAVNNPNFTVIYNALLQRSLTDGIKAIRIENTRTSFVHTFHIWAYLDSNGWLSKYKPWLDHTQVMYLYWNIAHIRKHAGTNHVFSDLVEHFLTYRNIPIYGHLIKHDLADLTKNFLPDVEFARTYINRSVNILDPTSTCSVKEIMEREVEHGIDKGVKLEQDIIATNSDLAISGKDDVRSRIFDSEVDDGVILFDYSLSDFLLSHWIEKVGDDAYLGRVVIDNTSNGDNYLLTQREALILWWYCKLRYYNIDIPNIPKVQALMVYSGMNQPRSFYNEFTDGYYITQWFTDTVLECLPRDGKVSNSRDFYAQTKGKFEFWTMTRKLELSLPHPTGRSRSHLLLNNLWHTSFVSLAPVGTKWDDWLSRHGIEMDAATDFDYKEMADSIFLKCTGGKDEKGEDRGPLQRAMLAVVEQFTGYNVQFLVRRKGEVVQSCGYKPAWLHPEQSKGEFEYRMPLETIGVVDITIDPEFSGGIYYPIKNVIKADPSIIALDCEPGIKTVPVDLHYTMELTSGGEDMTTTGVTGTIGITGWEVVPITIK